ncbi:glycosyltransferase family 61 protein [Caenispirillum salinarum]|uniref:glycosyltransferase family 61 protein n=1 Tax=Caenispirillum salinarum TaxID=859058 RepID=UPI00384AA878
MQSTHGALRRHLWTALAPAGAAAVQHGLPPAWLGHRWVRHESLPAFCEHRAGSRHVIAARTIHPERTEIHPLPRNVARRDDLPADRGWWGYSFHDVPARPSGATMMATLRDCTVAWFNDETRSGDWYPGILAGDGTALHMREIRFHPRHGDVLRHGGPPQRMRRATWFAERVYHNHSHWLTAHLPKLLLLRDLGLLGEVLLPPRRTPVIDQSLRLLGLEPGDFPTWEPDRPLRVDELTVVQTDRFRPDLVRQVPRAYGILQAPPPYRRVFISRAGATRRRLLNEDALWPMLRDAGFERVRMEDLDFSAQVRLMSETAVLCAPHGAGLTNMMFCPPGTAVVELADLSFPNPNFYALAAALGHDYWILPAQGHGDVHPLDKDLSADLEAVAATLPRWAPRTPAAGPNA